MVNGFSDGFAWVILNSKAGFVNASGKEIVAPKYEWPDFGPYDELEFDYYFFEGMAAFYSKGKFGFVDKSGKEIVRVDGNSIEMACPGHEKTQRLSFQKKNDPATGKAALFIEFKAAISTNRMYVAMENKSW